MSTSVSRTRTILKNVLKKTILFQRSNHPPCKSAQRTTEIYVEDAEYRLFSLALPFFFLKMTAMHVTRHRERQIRQEEMFEDCYYLQHVTVTLVSNLNDEKLETL